MRFAVALILSLGVCACGGAPSRPTAEVTAQSLLRQVPKDAAYWGVYVGSERHRSYEDQLIAIGEPLQELLAARGPKPSAPGIELAMWTVAEQFDGKLNAAGLAEIGVDRYMRFAMYPVVGVFPALRMGLLDVERFDAFLDRLVQASGAPVATTFPGGRYWRIDHADLEGAILAVRDADAITVALVLPEHVDAALAELTGKTKPVSPVTVDDLAALAKPHGVIPLQMAKVEPEKLFDAPIVKKLLTDMDSTCQDSVRYALSRTPRWLFGALPTKPGEALSYLYLVDLAKSSHAWWKSFLGPAPGPLDPGPQTVGYLTIGLSEDGLRGALVQLGQSWVDAPTKCSTMAQLNMFAPMVAGGAFPPPEYQLGGLTGVSMALRGANMDEPNVEIVFHTQSATTLRDALSEYVPEFLGLPATGAPVPAEDGFIIHRDGLIGFGTGTAKSLAAFAQAPVKTGPFLRFWMSSALAKEIQSEDMEAAGDGMLWDKFMALNAALAANDTEMSVALEESGFVFRAVSRRAAQP